MAGVTLQLDAERWREHLATVAGAVPGLVPVIKGNGYGYGLRLLAEESTRLGVPTVAVGTAAEVDLIREGYAGEVVILQPWEAGNDLALGLTDDPAVITTVSRLDDLQRLSEGSGSPRVLIEVLTSMRRHGISVDDLPEVGPLLTGLRFEGWTIHLPLLDEGRYAEAERLARAALDAAPAPLWLSHLPAEEAAALSRQLGGASGDPTPVRLRVGTRLWLGDESTRRSVATVLDVHPVRRGQRAGYRQRLCPANGWIVVVAGGTSHGIGLEALVSGAAAHAVEPDLPARQREAAGHRGRDPGRVAVDDGDRGHRRVCLVDRA